METIKLIDWLNCKDDLLKVFSKGEIETALKQTGYTKEDLTSIETFENEPYAKIKELVKDRYRGKIRVFRDVTVEGQTVSMEGYKEATVRDFRVIHNYQGLKHSKLISQLLQNRFKWFNKFKWDIYELRDLENYEVYLTTEEKHKSFKSDLKLYVPLKALLQKDKQAIENRNKEYWLSYCNSSYGLNKRNNKTLEQFNKRKEKERGEYLEVLNSKVAKSFFRELLK